MGTDIVFKVRIAKIEPDGTPVGNSLEHWLKYAKTTPANREFFTSLLLVTRDPQSAMDALQEVANQARTLAQLIYSRRKLPR